MNKYVILNPSDLLNLEQKVNEVQQLTESEITIIKGLKNSILESIANLCDELQRSINNQPENEKSKTTLSWTKEYRDCFERNDYHKALSIALRMIQSQMDISLMLASYSYVMIGNYREARFMAMRGLQRSQIQATEFLGEINVLDHIRVQAIIAKLPIDK